MCAGSVEPGARFSRGEGDVDPLVSDRGEHAQGAVSTPSVREDLDVLEQRVGQLGASPPALAVEQAARPARAARADRSPGVAVLHATAGLHARAQPLQRPPATPYSWDAAASPGAAPFPVIKRPHAVPIGVGRWVTGLAYQSAVTGSPAVLRSAAASVAPGVLRAARLPSSTVSVEAAAPKARAPSAHRGPVSWMPSARSSDR
jgi:hypothetical protein